MASRVLRGLVGPITLHLERAYCEELATTLARAMVRLSERPVTGPSGRPELRLVED